jgi:hypothetical protein
MRVSGNITVPGNLDPERVAQLEERVARLEARLGLTADIGVREVVVPPPALAPVFHEGTVSGETFEFELGQHWFALAGVAVLTAGLAFLLSLPYPSLPAAVPAMAGCGLAAALLAIAHVSPRLFSGGAGILSAAAMVLLGFSVLRLFFFGEQPAMDVNGLPGRSLLLAATAINAAISMRLRSPGLTVLALSLACAIALAVGSTWLTLVSVVAVAGVAVLASRRAQSLLPVLGGVILTHATYFLWSLGNPIRSGAVQFARDPVWAPAVLLGLMLLLGVAPLLGARQRDDAPTNVAAFANCAFGYGAFLIHTAASFPARFPVFNLAATVVFLGLAMLFYVRLESRVSTFFYAMTAYAALTLAIVRLAPTPDVFVWLSLQSVVVVATAIWFRSRFIVVGNFLIFAAIVVTYAAVTKTENGISVGFGIVALMTARILNWKQHRLELKTDFMRNAYLASAFVIFPYASYHLVPVKYVTLVWIALAAAYYVLNFGIRNQKYRWMGHGTLVLTTLYVIGVGVSRFEPVYRVLSFLALGAALLIVSLLFARARRGQAADASEHSEEDTE